MRVYFILNAFWFEAEVQSSRRRRDDILDVGESTLDVGELTVGETTRRQNDRNSSRLHALAQKINLMYDTNIKLNILLSKSIDNLQEIWVSVTLLVQIVAHSC